MKYYITTKDREIIEHTTFDGSRGRPRGLIYGVGVNDVDQPTQILINGEYIDDVYYTTWRGMIKRGYSSEYHKKRPTYIGVTVCKDWHKFSKFKGWMINQDWVGKQLDKDIIAPKNKEYSPEKCVFVRSDLNMLILHDNQNSGVGWHKKSSKYRAYISIDSKQKTLGHFETEEEAISAYIIGKTEKIQKFIKEYSGDKADDVKSGLSNHIKLLSSRHY